MHGLWCCVDGIITFKTVSAKERGISTGVVLYIRQVVVRLFSSEDEVIYPNRFIINDGKTEWHKHERLLNGILLTRKADTVGRMVTFNRCLDEGYKFGRSA
jgi:hypothetical protein